MVLALASAQSHLPRRLRSLAANISFDSKLDMQFRFKYKLFLFPLYRPISNVTVFPSPSGSKTGGACRRSPGAVLLLDRLTPADRSSAEHFPMP
jgi:hypothetical protein